MNFWRGTAYSCGGLFENAPVQDPGQTHEGRGDGLITEARLLPSTHAAYPAHAF